MCVCVCVLAIHADYAVMLTFITIFIHGWTHIVFYLVSGHYDMNPDAGASSEIEETSRASLRLIEGIVSASIFMCYVMCLCWTFLPSWYRQQQEAQVLKSALLPHSKCTRALTFELSD